MSANFINGTTKGLDLILINSPLKNYDIRPRLNDFTLPTIGLGYIATCAELEGYRVGVLDSESSGLGVSKVAEIVSEASPRWVGLNLLAPTYRHSVEILQKLDRAIRIMLGGHQAKAMPRRILDDPAIPRIDALILGEAETRVVRILKSMRERENLPNVYWREDGRAVTPASGANSDKRWLAPDIDALPFVDRKFLAQDPYLDNGVRESAMVASRGCPFDCSFCGAAISANPDVTIRMRAASNIIAEVQRLKSAFGVERVRFVDDLFLANRKIMLSTLGAFVADNIDIRWDATGRINVLAGASNDLLDLMVRSGCREVALGIETGSDRLLNHIDKKITVAQIRDAVRRLCTAGINIKGYFILGLPTETRQEQADTLRLIHELWDSTKSLPGVFRCSAFEYRPYPGTPDWARLVAAGYNETDMLIYADDSELIEAGLSPDRDEFNFSTGLQFGEVPPSETRSRLADIMRQQRTQ